MRLNQFIKVYILSKSLDLHIHWKCISTFTFYLKCKKKKNELINFISKCTDFIRWIYIIHVYDAIYFLSYPEQIISVLAFHQVLIIISTCSKSSTKFWLTFKTTRKWWFYSYFYNICILSTSNLINKCMHSNWYIMVYKN